MMIRFALSLAAAGLFAFAGCNDHAAGTDDGTKSHDYKPLHGGQLIHLADHGPIVEMVHDAEKGTLKCYVFTSHQEVQTIEVAPTLNLKDGPTQIKGEGSGAEWTFTHEKLKGHPHDVTLKIDIAGKTFTNDEWHPKEG